MKLLRNIRKGLNRTARFNALLNRVIKIQRDHGASHNASVNPVEFCKTATFNVTRTTRVIEFGRKHNLLSSEAFSNSNPY